MPVIKSLFDQSKDIYRTIEKVITYGADQEHRLKTEISEYIVTESIEEQFEKLLSKMQLAMESGGENEVGVWVSGFYGSGKSSFTKYLGLAFDDTIQVDGIPFREHLANRLNKAKTKALLSTVAKRFPASVILLDLASEMLAGSTMEDVSTVLYYKVLQWAGYSQNLKVAALERRLQQDNRYEEFKQKIQTDLGVEWSTVQNDPLVVDSMIPDVAHQMYPELFKTPTSFTTETSEFIRFENDRVEEMLAIVRENSGNEHIIFIIDEVGQYVGSRQNLILNLDGLAKNLKAIGDGKVWIIGTAQQTLTEDDPRAALNSPELHKVKDRFPIQIDLESSDIKEICYRRLLGKSVDGTKTLENLFTKHGQALRHSTKLEGAKYYDSEFNSDDFIKYYPFLPAHFDILLHLLGGLAKSTGGIGLRSAIKVVQDILVEGAEGHDPIAEQSIGLLATTVILYDALEKDIRRAFLSIHQSVGKVLIQFPDSVIHQDVAKSVAILQILSNLPVTINNVAGLMHPSIESPSLRDDVTKVVDELINNSFVPFGEQDGNLCFFSEKLNDIEQERAQLPLRTVETKRLFNESLKEAFSPLPNTRLDGSLVVRTGLKSQHGSLISSLSGERETIQTIIELVTPSDYDNVKTRLTDESRHPSSKHAIYFLGRSAPQLDEKVAEMYRCREICQRHRNDPDQEIKEYCSAQTDRAARLQTELQHLIKGYLAKGSFVFHGQATAVDSLDPDVLIAGKKHLSSVASQVFDRYSEASVRVETSIAEKFLRTGNLAAITVKIDPLELVKVSGGTPSINTNYQALISIHDYIDSHGAVEGKRLTEYFSNAPFGWSPDTVRYLIAALLVAGEIKLKVSGKEVKVNGQQAIDALKTNNAFKPVGVSLRGKKPPNEVLARAAERLTDLLGDTVIPLEAEISKTAAKNLPQFQSRFAPLGVTLSSLGLSGADRIQTMITDIADLLYTDASDAPWLLGGKQSALYDSLKWASEVDMAFKQGLESNIKELQQHRREINELPDSGVPGKLKEEVAEDITALVEHLAKDNFYEHLADLNTILTGLQTSSRDAAIAMVDSQKQSIKEAEKDLARLYEWPELTHEEQSDVLAQLEALTIDVSEDLQGLKQLIKQEFDINGALSQLKAKIIDQGQKRRSQRREDEKKKGEAHDSAGEKIVKIPGVVSSAIQLSELIDQLQQIHNEITAYPDMTITIQLTDKKDNE
jgi:hypothetical protein